MYIKNFKDDDGVTMIVYETLDELLKQDIVFMSEDSDFYYVRLKPQSYFENCIWKVDKRTGKAEYMMYTEYIIDISDLANEIDPTTLKRVS